MAVVKRIQLKKYRMADAYKTAAAGMSGIQLVARIAGTFYESLYGKERFDVVVFGDDPLIGLATAAQLSQSGKRVLLAPDSLEREHWPAEDWGQMMLAIQNHFEPELSVELNQRFSGLSVKGTYLSALSSLIGVCENSGLVMLLSRDHLKSSAGYIKGSSSLIFFPSVDVSPESVCRNPMWSMVSRKIPCLEFCHREIEFIEAGNMVYTTPLPSRIAPILGLPIGQAREEKGDLAEGGRLDDLKSAFSNLKRSN